MHQLTAPFRGRRHDTPVSDQVSDNGTEHSGISVPGPGRLATGKIIKRRPSEVLRDKEVAGSNPVTPTSVFPYFAGFQPNHLGSAP